MWVRFTSDFIFVPDEDRRSAVKYRAGYEGSVRRQCADKAIAAGKATRRRTPQRVPSGDVEP